MMAHETMPQSPQNMEYVWRVMRFQHYVGYHTFGWRMGSDDLVVLAVQDVIDDDGNEREGKEKKWTDS